MKKTLALSIFTFMQASLFAKTEINLKFREAYTYFNKKYVREIYPGAVWSSQIEADFDFFDYFGIFLNADYLHKTGKSVVLKHHTSLDMGTLSVGIKFASSKFKSSHPYLGLGVSEAIIHTHDRYHYVKKITNRFSTGLVAKSGCQFTVNRHLIIDLFLDYSYQPMHIYYKPDLNRKTQDVGSLKFGLGIGYRF